MNRRGFALVAVLWTLVALATLAGAGLASIRLGVTVSRNRILLGRAAWAREACAEILLARLTASLEARSGEHDSSGGVDTVNLGRGTWCRASTERPAAQLNLNLASRAALLRLFGSEEIVAAILQQRPLPSAEVVQSLAGWDAERMTTLLPLVTTRGDGRIDLNRAPPAVLLALPGMTDPMVERLMRERAMGRQLEAPEELPSMLPEDLARSFGPRYGAFLQAAVTQPAGVIATIEGGVRGSPLIARATLTLARANRRFAVMQRETE